MINVTTIMSHTQPYKSHAGLRWIDTSKIPYITYDWTPNGWDIISGNGIGYNPEGNVAFKENAKILGTNQLGQEFELIGLGEYTDIEEIPLQSIQLNVDLAGHTIFFDTSKKVTLNSRLTAVGGLYLGTSSYLEASSRNNSIIWNYKGEETLIWANDTWFTDNIVLSDSDTDLKVTDVDLPASLAPNSEFTWEDAWYQVSNPEYYDQIEVGSTHIHLNLNTSDDPVNGTSITVDTPYGKESIPYKSELTSIIEEVLLDNNLI